MQHVGVEEERSTDRPTQKNNLVSPAVGEAAAATISSPAAPLVQGMVSDCSVFTEYKVAFRDNVMLRGVVFHSNPL